MTKYNTADIKEQTKFCKNLMNRLYNDININVTEVENTYGGSTSVYGIYGGYTNKQDIIRLRRELNKLSKMVSGC